MAVHETSQSAIQRRICFGAFELLPQERRLRVNGQPAALGGRAFDLLLVLVQRAGQLITKQELLDFVWPGLVVEEANLTVQVSALRKVLGGEAIATIAGRGYRFVAPLAAGMPASPREPASPPLSTPLIGRDDELEQLTAALHKPGCVTLTGPAGVGKSSLARTLAARHAAGAVWLDLAADGEAGKLDDIDGQTLGARLLVLDNAEQEADAAARVAARLLRAEPGLHLLVTSQIPLAITAERVVRIEPLALPLDRDTLDLHQGAVALFVERAQAADQRFRATAESLPLLREICRRLDGLPLAIELAAARVPALGLMGLRDALSRCCSLLNCGKRDAPERQRSLRAALDRSHALLEPREQRLLHALSVFDSPFTLEQAHVAARNIAPDRWGVIESLGTLVMHSLVSVDRCDPPHYRMLETTRCYALERLAASRDEPLVRLRQPSSPHALSQALAL